MARKKISSPKKTSTTKRTSRHKTNADSNVVAKGDSDKAASDIVASEPVTAKPSARMIKKKDIYAHVSVVTGLHKRDVREAVDCLLEYMNQCLQDGKDLQLPPLGKIKSIKRGEGDAMKMHHKVIIRKPMPPEKNKPEPKEGLDAEPDSV